MSTAQHTPGPWHIVPYETLIRIHTNPEGPYLGTVANLDWWTDPQTGPTKQVALANARLISAAPEMLAALKAIQEPLAKQASQPGNTTAWPYLEQIRAAIAKAEERS